MIEIKIHVSDVDYTSALDALLPVIDRQLEKNENPVVGALLVKLRQAGSGAARLVLNALPQRTKDELAVACLEHYKESIPKLLINAAKEKNISLDVEDVTISMFEASDS